jgi:hypothetical protein
MSISTGGAIVKTTRYQRSFAGLALLVLLGACSGGGDGAGTGSAGTVQLAQTTIETTEGAVVNVFVNRSGGSAGQLTVHYATANDTALAGSDYAAASGVLTWPDNMSGNQTVSIAINDDSIAEAVESFTLTLSNVTGGGFGANISATVNIVDNDDVALAAVGTITGLDSATVNGIRYDTNAAAIFVNGLPATAAQLKLGQIVSLAGNANFSTATGRADEIRYVASLLGPVEEIDATAGRFIAMGQTVVPNDETVFAAGIDPDTFAGLDPGSIAEVSGFRNAAGDIVATRIAIDENGTDRQAIGTVAGLDLASMSFSINRLIVDYSGAAIIDLPEGMPANGLLVMVRGTYNDGVLTVDEISAGDMQAAEPGGRGHIGGIVTRYASAADFDLNGMQVTTDAGTAYVNGIAADLQADAAITIDGEFSLAGDSVSAYQVIFGRPVYDRTTTTYGFEDFTEISVGSLSRVIVTQGPEYLVQVTAGTAALGDLQVEQTANKISLGLSNTHIFNALITMPVLDRIEVSNNALANVTVKGFSQAQMAIDLGGVSVLRGEDLDVGSLDATVSGVSLLSLGDSRPIETASIDISGVSQATLNMGVGSALAGSVRTGQGTGVSRLFYYGTNVALDVSTDTLSTVTRLGDTRP